MKQVFFLLTTLAGLTFTSCNDDDTGGGSGDPTTPTGTISATLTFYDGGVEAPTPTAWSLPLVSGARIQNRISLIANDPASGISFNFNIPDNGVGAYFNDGEFADLGLMTYAPDPDNIATFQSVGSGQPIPASMYVVISEIDTVAKTFSGSFIGSLTQGIPTEAFAIFENGSFNDVPYTTSIDGGGGGSTGTGEVTFKLDGEDFIQDNIITTEQSIINVINFTSQDASGALLSVNVPNTITSGTTLDFGGFPTTSHFASFILGDGTNLSVVEGSLTVTTHDPENNFMEGTFSFGLGQFLQPATNFITEGTFEINYE